MTKTTEEDILEELESDLREVQSDLVDAIEKVNSLIEKSSKEVKKCSDIQVMQEIVRMAIKAKKSQNEAIRTIKNMLSKEDFLTKEGGIETPEDVINRVRTAKKQKRSSINQNMYQKYKSYVRKLFEKRYKKKYEENKKQQ